MSRPNMKRHIKEIVLQSTSNMVELIMLLVMSHNAMSDPMYECEFNDEVMNKFGIWHDELLNTCLNFKRLNNRHLSDFKYNLGSSKGTEKLFMKLDKIIETMRNPNSIGQVVKNSNRLRNVLLDVVRILESKTDDLTSMNNANFETLPNEFNNIHNTGQKSYGTADNRQHFTQPTEMNSVTDGIGVSNMISMQAARQVDSLQVSSLSRVENTAGKILKEISGYNTDSMSKILHREGRQTTLYQLGSDSKPTGIEGISGLKNELGSEVIDRPVPRLSKVLDPKKYQRGTHKESNTPVTPKDSSGNYVRKRSSRMYLNPSRESQKAELEDNKENSHTNQILRTTNSVEGTVKEVTMTKTTITTSKYSSFQTGIQELDFKQNDVSMRNLTVAEYDHDNSILSGYCDKSRKIDDAASQQISMHNISIPEAKQISNQSVVNSHRSHREALEEKYSQPDTTTVEACHDQISNLQSDYHSHNHHHDPVENLAQGRPMYSGISAGIDADYATMGRQEGEVEMHAKNAVSANQFNTNQQSEAITFNNMCFEHNFVSNTSEQNKILKNFLTFSNNQGAEQAGLKDGYMGQHADIATQILNRHGRKASAGDLTKNYRSDTDKSPQVDRVGHMANLVLGLPQPPKKRQSEQFQSNRDTMTPILHSMNPENVFSDELNHSKQAHVEVDMVVTQYDEKDRLISKSYAHTNIFKNSDEVSPTFSKNQLLTPGRIEAVAGKVDPMTPNPVLAASPQRSFGGETPSQLDGSAMDFRLNCDEAMNFDTKKFLSHKKAEKLHVNISKCEFNTESLEKIVLSNNGKFALFGGKGLHVLDMRQDKFRIVRNDKQESNLVI